MDLLTVWLIKWIDLEISW